MCTITTTIATTVIGHMSSICKPATLPETHNCHRWAAERREHAACYCARQRGR